MTISRVLPLSGALLLVAVHLSGQQPHPIPAGSAPPALVTSTRAIKGDAEHGRYIVDHIAMCGECHSGRNPQGEILPDERFMGGSIPFSPPWPNDWALRAPRNAGLPGYTDELAIRLLTQGAIDREGRQLRPPMPRFRMTPQDAADVVAYMKSR